MGRTFRVMIDARMLIGRFSGVARFVTRLVEELTKQEGVQVVALCGDKLFKPWAGRSDIEMVRTKFTRRKRSVPRRVLWEATRLPRIIADANVDLFHATWNFGIPSKCPVPSVLTIHDLIPWSGVKERHDPVSFILCYRRAVRSAARRAGLVITVTETVRRQILKHVGVPPEKVMTVFNGVDLASTSVTSEAESDDWFVLYVGGHEARKNVAGVLRSMQVYWQRYDENLEVRLTGDADSLSQEAASVLRELPANAPVTFLGDLSNEELSRQYATAQMLLMLSHDEGFGLPALEAMAHGCPVIASNCSSLPEVVGDAGLLVHPDQPGGVADTMDWLMIDPARQTEYALRGRARAAVFGWDRTASRMRTVYESVLTAAERASHGGTPPAPAGTTSASPGSTEARLSEAPVS